MIDCVYIIGLNIQENREKITKKFSELGLKFNRCVLVEGVNGLQPQVDFEYSIHNWKIEGSNNDWYNRGVLAGEIGCALSHLKIWKHAYEEQHEKILILEEDFKKAKDIEDSFFEELDALEWDLCYLGRNKIRPDQKQVSKNIVVPDYSYCTHAYLLSKAGIKNLIDQKFENKIMPVDEFLTATYCEHPRKDLHFIWRDIRAFSIKEDCVGQTSTKETSVIGHGSFDAMRSSSAVNASVTNYSDWDEWKKKYITPAMLAKDFDLIVDEPVSDVLHFPIFNKNFCEEIIQLAEKDGKWTEGRHEYYPTHDMLLDSLGMDEIFYQVQKEYVFPLACHHFHLDGDKWRKLRPENFIIKYSLDKQGFLSLHHDQSVLSSVLTLNEEYEGGGTFFYRQQKTLKGKTGEMSLHPGMVSHRHGARPITSGKRYVLVSFLNMT